MTKVLGRLAAMYLLFAVIGRFVEEMGAAQCECDDGDWNDPDAGLAECCRASVALDKALAKSIRRARDAGRSWSEIGQALGVAENAQSWPEVREAMAHSRQLLWDRAFTSDP